MNRVDIARFEFDFDMTWSAFFTDSKLRIYSRYGGRDEHEPESRMSKPSLLQTMREVLAAHREAKGIAAAGDAVPVWHPEPKASLFPSDMPLLRKNHNGCLHCHQVREYSVLQAFHDGRFRREMLFPFPLPESAGVDFDKAHGHRLHNLASGSPAESAGLRNGDVIVQAADVPIRSEFDFRWALHRLPTETRSVPLRVQRVTEDKPTKTSLINLDLPLSEQWRFGDTYWRKSTRSTPVDLGFRGAPLSKSQRRELNLSQEMMAIQVFSIRPRGFSAALGLQKGDIIISLAGQSRDVTTEHFRSDLLRRFAPGDEVRLTILRDGQSLELTGRLPDWFTEETSVP